MADDVARGRVPDKDRDEPLRQPRTAEHELIAAFGAPQAGERAVDALRRAGVGAHHLTVLEREQGTLVSEGESPEEEPERDVQWLVRFARGSAAGGTAGAAFGLLIGLVLFVGMGRDPGWAGVAAAVVAIGAAGAMAGGMAGVFLNLWDMSYRDAASEGRVLVEVHTDDEAEAKRAISVLQRHHPARLDHFDKAGERLGLHH